MTKRSSVVSAAPAAAVGCEPAARPAAPAAQPRARARALATPPHCTLDRLLTMAELAIKHAHINPPLPLRIHSFYELYKRFLKEHGCKWHDVLKLLSMLGEYIFDDEHAYSKLSAKVSVILDSVDLSRCAYKTCYSNYK